MSILIKNVLHNNEIVNVFINNNKFTKISKGFEAAADIVIDGDNKAIMPAFYNTHNHAAMSILRGYSDDKNLQDWLTQDIWPIEAKLTPEDIYIASRLAILEMIKSGTVFFADMYFFNEPTMQAVKEMGVRAAISFFEMDMFDKNITTQKIEKTKDFINMPNPCPERIIKGISCHSVYSVSEELLQYSAKIAKQEDYFMQIHVAETQKEVSDCLEKCGKTPVAKLKELGLLSPKTILSHAVYLSEQDIIDIKTSGSYIATNPVSNLKLNSGMFMFDKLYSEMPDKITLGTDGACSNNNLNMLESMKICSLIAKIQANKPTSGKSENIFSISTRNGAKAFGLNTGIVKEGALADCILVDLNNPFMTPNYNLISNLVYSADSSCIKDVICNGKIIMRENHVDNEKDIIKQAQLLAEKIKKI
ncbi:MAG: amidohydrolase [Alphaproteobacteria bacterium]|nr:amidohydrolase [Alphaproteobacteria bacterium]